MWLKSSREGVMCSAYYLALFILQAPSFPMGCCVQWVTWGIRQFVGEGSEHRDDKLVALWRSLGKAAVCINLGGRFYLKYPWLIVEQNARQQGTHTGVEWERSGHGGKCPTLQVVAPRCPSKTPAQRPAAYAEGPSLSTQSGAARSHCLRQATSLSHQGHLYQ